MTVNTETYKHVYPTNGTEDTFSFAFEIQHKNQLSVELISSSGVSTSKSLDIDYIVTGTGNTLNKTNYTSGSIVFYDVPADDQSVLITLSVPATQINRFVEGSAFPSKTIEESLDKLTLKIKQLQEEISRCVKVSDVLSESTDFSFPVGAPYYYLRYNSAGTGFDAVEGSPKDDIIVELDPDPHLGNHLETNGFEIVGNSVVLNPTNEIQLKSNDVGISQKIYLLTDSTAYWDLTSTTQTWYISSNSIIDLTISGLRIGGSGVRASTISNDNTLAANSATTLVTQSAVKGFGENTFIKLASPTMTGNFDTNGYSFVTTSDNKSMTFDCHGSGSINLLCDSGGYVTVNALGKYGETSTNITFSTNQIVLNTNNVNRLDVNNSGMQLGATGARVTTISNSTSLSDLSQTSLITEYGSKQTLQNKTASNAQVAAQTAEYFVDASRLFYHPAAAKFWGRVDTTGTIVLETDFNILSITDNGTGDYTIRYDYEFDETGAGRTNNSIFAMPYQEASSSVDVFAYAYNTPSVSQVAVRVSDVGGSLVDPEFLCVGGFGVLN